MEKPLKTVSLDLMIDKHTGKIGTPRRDAFENELKIEILKHKNSINLKQITPSVFPKNK